MKKILVKLCYTRDCERIVGQLAEKSGRVYFEYSSAFLDDPLPLSPFKLAAEPGLHEHVDRSFGPLFGLFDDSLPDGWGLLLMDRYLASRGIVPETVSVLDRLAFLGSKTMGALTYHPPADHEPLSLRTINLHEMSTEATTVMHGKSKEVLPALLRAGGSPGGARPKVLVGVKGSEMVSGESDLPDDYAHWLIKFSAKKDDRDEGVVEYAYARMAEAAGIHMPQTHLFETEEDERFFGVRRFDRVDGRRVHVHTFGNLIHSNFRIPNCDYQLLLKVTKILTKNHQDVEAMFRRMVFNVMANNRDDHVKNFAFILEKDGWRISPAYDLTFSRGPGGQHTMTVAGEGENPKAQHMMRVADAAGIGSVTARGILEQVADAVSQWPAVAKEVGVSDPMNSAIHKALAQRVHLF